MYSTFYHGGERICKGTFLFLHNMGEGKLKRIKSSFLNNGLKSRYKTLVVNIITIYLNRCHGNIGRAPKHALTDKELQHVTDFIENYARVHAILLPGRIPGLKDEKAMLLPSEGKVIE